MALNNKASTHPFIRPSIWWRISKLRPKILAGYPAVCSWLLKVLSYDGTIPTDVVANHHYGWSCRRHLAMVAVRGSLQRPLGIDAFSLSTWLRQTRQYIDNCRLSHCDDGNHRPTHKHFQHVCTSVHTHTHKFLAFHIQIHHFPKYIRKIKNAKRFVGDPIAVLLWSTMK